jgi:hypothetical protein
MTHILQVLTQYCAPYVDDIRLQEKQTDNPPVFAWTMWQYLLPQMARFTIPVEMPEYLFGTENQPNLIEPNFANTRYIAQTDLISVTTISLGAEYTGFELFSAHILIKNEVGDIISEPTEIVAYNANDGTITINASTENPIASGTTFDLDFYTDGYFKNTLSPEIMTILGICFEYGWAIRFENDWLSNVPKVEDKSFSQQNIANRMDKGTYRLEYIYKRLAGAMRRLEQNKFYQETIPSGARLKI